MHILTSFSNKKLLRILLPLLIFFGITLAVALPRIGIPYSWDDGASYRLVSATIPVTTNIYNTLSRQAFLVWYDTGNPSTAYRPLNSLMIIAEVLFFGTNTLIPDFIQAASLGLTSVVIYFLASKMTGKKIIGVGAAILFAFSIPTLGLTWILLNKQPQVSLVIVSGLLGYVQYVETRARKWLALFWICCLIGPMVRELTIILPLTALCDTIIERRKNALLVISLPFLTAYGFFPSFLPNLILYGRVVVQSTVTRGYAATQIGSTGLGLAGLHYEIPYVLILFLPYIITIPAVVSIAIFLIRLKRLPRLAALLLAIGFLILGFITLVLFPILVPGYNPTEISVWLFLPSIFLSVLSIAAMSFSFNRLLSIWFFISFLPFYEIYTEDVHLAPASIPWIIIILIWIGQLPTLKHIVINNGALKTFNRPRIVKLTRFILLSIIVIGFAEQSLNIYPVYSTFNGMTQEVQTMTNLMLSNSPQGGLAIANFPLAGNIALYSNGLFQNKLALGSFVWPFSNEVLGNETVYYTIFPSMLNQSVFFILQTSPIDVPTYGGLFDGMLSNVSESNLDVSYPLLDPMEGILPRGYAQFPGPSDLGGDLVLINNPLSREYYANYTVSKFEPCQGSVCISALNYGGCYNVFSTNNTYYAISKEQGFFNSQVFSQGGYHGVISGNSTDQFEQDLNAAVNVSAPDVISDDGQSSFYSVQGIDHGNLSVPMLTEDSSVLESGRNSLSINISSQGTYGGIRVVKNYQTAQNWCSFNTLSFWMYGLDSGDKVIFNIADGIHNRSWSINDNYSGWKQFYLPLKNPIGCQGNNCENLDLSNVATFYWDFHTVGDHRIDDVELEP